LLRYNFRLEYGVDFGALTVPFKLQASDGTITAGASVGPYLGWKQRWFGVPSTVLGSAGLSVIPIQDVNAASVDTKAGLTICGGLVFELARQFQLGLVFGRDHLGGVSGKAYPYEDKTWISFAIGFAFTQ
jgi:hypothetical protein